MEGCGEDTSYPPVQVGPLGVGDFITEAWARWGSVIDQVTLRVTYFNGTGQDIQAGGPFGSNTWDATPDPAKYGKCFLVGVAGTDICQITQLTFQWSCQGFVN